MSFELSLFAFTLIVAVSHMISVGTAYRVPLPFLLGAITLIGYATAVLPNNFVEMSRLKDVGYIAFTVLVIHNGTTLNLRRIKQSKRGILLTCSALLATLGVGLIALAPFFGRSPIILATSSMVGGGATAAILSIFSLRNNPEFFIFPWLIFMVQGFFSIPIARVCLQKGLQKGLQHAVVSRGAPKTAATPTTSTQEVQEVASQKIAHHAPSTRIPIPERYKSPAYYLAMLIAIALLNNWIFKELVSVPWLYPPCTALLWGMLLSNLRVLEQEPLNHTNAMGLLILGLMSLLSDSLSQVSFAELITLFPLVLGASLFVVLFLCLFGALFAKFFGYNKTFGIGIVASSLVGYPTPYILIPILCKGATGSEPNKNPSGEHAKKHMLIANAVFPAVVVTNGLSLLLGVLLLALW